MIREVAILPVREGGEDGFVEAMGPGGGSQALTEATGGGTVRIGRGVENPHKFCLLVEWASLEAHNAARDSEAFTRFKTIAGPFFGAGGGFMEHFDFG